MICSRPEQFGHRTLRHQWRQTSTTSAQDTCDAAMNMPLPLLTAIAGELRKARGVNEPAPLLTARQLLEEAFRSINQPSLIASPHTVTEVSYAAC